MANLLLHTKRYKSGYKSIHKKLNRKEMKIVEFKDFFNLMKPMLKGRANATLVRELVSMITSLDSNIDPSRSQSDNTLKAYANGNRELSDEYARSILDCLDYRNFIESINSRDDALIGKFAESFAKIDSAVTEDNVGEKAADAFLKILYERAGDNSSQDLSIGNIKKHKLKYYYGERLLIEAKGSCPNKCGKPLYISSNRKTTPSYEIAIIDADNSMEDYENLIALCPECFSLHTLSPNEDDVEELLDIKNMLMDRELGDTSLSVLSIEKGIENILENLGAVDYRNLPRLNYDAVKVEDKIYKNDFLLIRKNIENVTSYFLFIDEKLKGMAKENRIHYEQLSMQVRMAYLEASKTLVGQAEIYESLVDWLHKKTKQRKESCEIMISYFVQKCEVFDAITK